MCSSCHEVSVNEVLVEFEYILGTWQLKKATIGCQGATHGTLELYWIFATTLNKSTTMSQNKLLFCMHLISNNAYPAT